MSDVDNMQDGSSESGGLSFQIGLDYNNLAVPDASIGQMPAQELPDDFSMGAVSADVGAMQDAMQFGLLNSGVPDQGIVQAPSDGNELALGLPEQLADSD
jgi:hypothetical protein